VLLTDEGHLATGKIPLDFNAADEEGWIRVLVPLDKFGLSRDAKGGRLERIALAGDAEESFWVGSMTLVVEDQPLYADAGETRKAKAGEKIRFRGADQKHPIKARYAWDFDDLVDGVTEDDFGQEVEWDFPEAGFYAVTLTVSDPDGRRVARTDKVTVQIEGEEE
jgi:hypothetical protein